MGCILRLFPVHITWFVLLFTWILFHFSGAAGIHSSFLNSYLDDLLAMPLVLGGILAFFRRWVFRSAAFQLSTFQIWSTVAIFSLYFEWLVMYIKPGFTADGWDVLCYALGGLFFQLVINKPMEKQVEVCEL